MKRRIIPVASLVMILVLSTSLVLAGRPPRTTLSVTILSPVDGLEVSQGSTFDVEGYVQAQMGDAGSVQTYVQYAVGAGSTDFKNVDGTDLQILSGLQPQISSLLRDEQYAVSWTLIGDPGVYEIRIYSQGATAKSGTSEPRTVMIAPQPIPGVELVDAEYLDPSIGFGSATGTYTNTYCSDDIYEVLSEGVNAHGTKKPGDDTTQLGWIFTFDLPTPRTATTFYFYGYAALPEGDGDTAFFVQEESGGVWTTILEISHTTGSKILFGDVTDSISPILKLRIVDNDRTVGNRVISSLYIDHAFIGLDDYQAPVSGIEILTAPCTCHRFQAWENYGNDWYHDADIPIGSSAATDIVIADLDVDGRNELVVAEVIDETYGVGIIEIFDLDSGTSPTDTLILPAQIGGAVMSIAVGDFDGDADLEIVGASSMDGAAIWDKVDGEYQVVLTLMETGLMHLVAAGNLDEDSESEIVFAVVRNSVDSDVALYDYDSGLGTWINRANYSSFSTPGDGFAYFYHMKISDIDSDAIGEIFVMAKDNPFHILSYANGELVDFWSVPDVMAVTNVGASFVAGDVTNDGFMDIVFYSPFLGTGTGFRVFEYDALIGFVNTYNISNPGMANLFGDQMAVGDIDGDLMNELVVSGGPGGIYSEGKMYIFRYDTLIFTSELSATESNCVVIGDYDNDVM